jgi:dihydroxyacetone kinase
MVNVMSYTGDVLHFGMAVKKARERGIKVDMLVLGMMWVSGEREVGELDEEELLVQFWYRKLLLL